MDRRAFLLILPSLMIAGASARADRKGRDDDDDDRDRADEVLRERTAGRIKPLAEILAIVRRRFPGRVLRTEFENDDGVPMYEVYILQPNGRRREVKLDARNGRILEVED